MEKKYNSLVSESSMRQFWDEQKVYHFDAQRGPIFSIDTPPPTVSGALHIGHIFSYTQTDIIARYKRLAGHAVFYPFGFDDNGLPTERFVEKQRGIAASRVGRSAFIKACLEETAAVEKQFEDLWKQMGLSVDWQKCYSTIDKRTRTISQASFIDLYKKGFIYRKEEPALFDTVYRTSVAQADLEDIEKETIFNDIAFTTPEGQELLIGTTRPELLPSCVALFYNPNDARYQLLQGKKTIVPLYGYEVPILADEKVQIEKGTGLVMCCTFGDKTDIEWFKKHALPYRQSIGFDGKFLERTGQLAGLKVPEARKKIIELLKEKNLIRHQKLILHSVSIYERSKNEIEYVMLPQWFLKILPFKKELLQAAEKIHWYPSFMKARFIDWVEHLQWDWCLSRQRTFGIPFPVWHNQTTGEILLPDEKDLPVDPQEQSYPGTIAENDTIVPDTDVMDTWNTSSLTPYICREMFQPTKGRLFHAKLSNNTADRADDFIPMGMRPQAHDIIRTWAFYTIIKTWMHEGKIPWKNIVISGHVLSAEAEKISKSKGNVPVEPQELLKKYPADAIRYWTASGTLGHDIAFSETKLISGQKLLVKLWNAALFVKEHLQDIKFDLEKNKIVSKETNSLVNQWVLHHLSETYLRYTSSFDSYEFGLALQAIENFFWKDFCDNYLELIKDQLFNATKYKADEIDETKKTLAHAFVRILQLYAPYIPHITETLYQEIFKDTLGVTSLHLTRFDDLQKGYIFPDAAKQVALMLQAVGITRKLKSDMKVSLKTELAECIIVAPEDLLHAIKPLETVLKGIINAKIIAYVTESTAGSLLEERNGTWHATVYIE
jgi:valyl-tRNA synthetase